MTTQQQCFTPTIWLFETIERSQLKGLILSCFSCNGQRDDKKRFWSYRCINIAWIHKTVHIDAALCELCLHMQYFLRVDCVMSKTIRQFARKLLLNSNLRKWSPIPIWPILNCQQPNSLVSSNFTYQWTGQSKRTTLFVVCFSRLICHIQHKSSSSGQIISFGTFAADWRWIENMLLQF